MCVYLEWYLYTVEHAFESATDCNSHYSFQGFRLSSSLGVLQQQVCFHSFLKQIFSTLNFLLDL